MRGGDDCDKAVYRSSVGGALDVNEVVERKTLLELWYKSKLSVDMAIGHILQRLLDLEERLRTLEREADRPSENCSNQVAPLM